MKHLWKLVVVLSLLLLSCAGETPTPIIVIEEVEVTPTPSVTPEPTDTAEPTETPPPTNTPTITPTPKPTATPRPTRTPTPTPEPVTIDIDNVAYLALLRELCEDSEDLVCISGSGDDVIDVELPDDTIITAVVSGNRCDRYFGILAYARDGDRVGGLVNTTSPYIGATLFMPRGNKEIELEVDASCSWEGVLVAPSPWSVSATMNVGDTVRGREPTVIRVNGEGASRITAEHTGRRNFVVWTWGEDRRDLAFNEIGDYSGTSRVPAGLFLLEVTAEGPWEITVY